MTDGNKDEAVRCVRIAEAALACGDRQRAFKFIKIARRLDPNIPVEGLLAACEKLDSGDPTSTMGGVSGERVHKAPSSSNSSGSFNSDPNYTEEHVEVIREIGRSKDYYTILRVEKSCSRDEIRRAYRKLSLKVHPDKNKAPGAEEAFKTVCKAFKCLSDEESRRLYDRTGLLGDFEINQHFGGVRRRRRRAATRNGIFDEDFDPDDIFGAFFGYQGDVFRARHVHRTRATPRHQRNNRANSEGIGFLGLLQLLPILIVFIFAYLPYSEPEYSLRQSYTFQIPKITEKHGVEYYVRSADFDQQYPLGSPSREKLEDDILKDHRSVLTHYCNIELHRRQWSTNYPTPYCDKLRSLIAA
uniref:Chaperone protein dnaJ 49 n=1 Tax=Anthurium amnicola TaxID=1678845 RepID=A0A1D1XD74_9ARAE